MQHILITSEWTCDHCGVVKLEVTREHVDLPPHGWGNTHTYLTGEYSYKLLDLCPDCADKEKSRSA